MAHPDHTPPRPPPPCFSLGVLAPLGYDPPGLRRWLRARLLSLLSGKRFTHRVFAHGVTGEPVSRVAADLMHELGTQFGGLGGGGRHGRHVEHVRACCHVASFSDAVVLVHAGDGLTADLRRLVGVCEWLGTGVRVLAFAGDPVPL